MKQVTNYPGYFITTDGKVFSKRGECSQQTLRSGHKRVYLSRNNNVRGFLVHVLVLETYVGSRPEGQVCRHLNGNPQDNRLENLCWGTHQQNAIDCSQHGNNPVRKLSNDDVRQIRRMLSSHTLYEIAEQFGVDHSTVYAVKVGKTYKYLEV